MIVRRVAHKAGFQIKRFADFILTVDITVITDCPALPQPILRHGQQRAANPLSPMRGQDIKTVERRRARGIVLTFAYVTKANNLFIINGDQKE